MIADGGRRCGGVAAHDRVARQPAADAGHAEPRLARGGALAHRVEPDRGQAHPARPGPRRQRHHRHRAALPRHGRIAAVRRPGALRPGGTVEAAARRTGRRLADRRRSRTPQRREDLDAVAGRRAGSEGHGLCRRLPEGDGDRLPGRRRRDPQPAQAHRVPRHVAGRRHGDLGVGTPRRRADVLRPRHRPRRALQQRPPTAASSAAMSSC